MRVSQKDIAERLNISTMTVSWTLAGKGDAKRISKATQERVFALAKELNYQPNLLARSLNQGFSGILGLILPDITDSFYGAIARQIETEAEKRGYTLMICSSLYDHIREERMISLFRGKQVDGIILAPAGRPEGTVAELPNNDIPVVAFDQILPHFRGNSILVDNQEATHAIISGMIQCGARHIALLSANPSQFTIRERKMGYKRALKEAGIAVDENLIAEVPFESYHEDIIDALDRVFRLCPQVDGFFLTSHILALDVLKYFHERHIDINKGFHLGCFHGVTAFQALAPGIRVARMPVEDIGRHAVRIVCEQIEKRKQQSPIQFEQLILPCTY